MTWKKKCLFNHKIVRETRGTGLIKQNEFPFLCLIHPFSNSLCNSSVSLPITDNTRVGFQTRCLLLKIPWRIFLCLSLAIQTLEQCNSFWKEHHTSQNSLCLKRIVVNCLIESYCLSEGPSLRLTKSPWGWITLFKLSVEMKRKTTYQHLDIASLWQIMVLLEWWLGMAGQKFMNSQCGRYRAEIADGKQFCGTRQGDSWCVCVCAWGFINVLSFLAVRVETQIMELTWERTQ